MFQYISCYSLSEQQPEKVWRQECFNTSHVTLYHKGQKVYSSWSGGFNTSHVTLYRQLAAQLHKFLLVSIHLMLLFILCKNRVCIRHQTFQYISCYSLSNAGENNYTKYWRFQYISCYSLSEYAELIGRLKALFQYISCYSLSVQKLSIHVICDVSIHLMLLFIS